MGDSSLVNASRAQEVFLHEVLEVWLRIIGTEEIMAWADLAIEASVFRVHVVDSPMTVASTEDEEATEEADTEIGLVDIRRIRDRISTIEMATSHMLIEIGRTALTDGAMLTLKEDPLITEEIASETNREARAEASRGLLRRILPRRTILGAEVNLIQMGQQRGFRRKSNRRRAVTVILKTITVTMKTCKRMSGSTVTKQDIMKKINKACQTTKTILAKLYNTLYLSRKDMISFHLTLQTKILLQHLYMMSQILMMQILQRRQRSLSALKVLFQLWRNLFMNLIHF